MIAWNIAAQKTRRDIWALTSRLLLLGVLASLVFMTGRILLKAASGGFNTIALEVPPWSLVLAAIIYLAGHGLRILRLALLIGSWRVGFRTIVNFHFMTAAASLSIPLKLGEIYRIIELSNVVGSFTKGLAIVWWERIFDASVILLILLLALARAPDSTPPEFAAVALVTIGFIAVTGLTFFVLPDNLRRLSMQIIRRYSGRRTVPVLKVVDLMRNGIQEAPRMVTGKVASLVTLTSLIWTCEIICFALAFPHASIGNALDSLLNFLSAVTRGETLLGALGKAEESTLAYLAATQIPLEILGLVAAIQYVIWRMRRHS